MRKTSSTLVAAVLALLALGIVMLASTSSVKGLADFNDPHYFLKRQLIWLGLALVAGAGASQFHYQTWRRYIVPMVIAGLGLLALVFVPGVGVKVGGSHRWLRGGPLSFQPSELVKLITIMAMAVWIDRSGRRMGTFVDGLLIPLCGLGAVLALLMLEPDYGTTLLTGMVGMAMLFAGGTKLGYLVVSGALGAGLFGTAIMMDPVRMSRVLAFAMPEKFPATAYHLAQSKIAFIRGGWIGVGLGNSIQKQFYLPEAHTDFIFAIIGEELGFIATLSVAVLFLVILVCGMMVSLKAPDTFGKLLAFGITIMIALQAAINIGVVTGCLPTKGLALPFISYGGSSLLMSVVSVCVLLNVAAQVVPEKGEDPSRAIKNKAHRL